MGTLECQSLPRSDRLSTEMGRPSMVARFEPAQRPELHRVGRAATAGSTESNPSETREKS